MDDEPHVALVDAHAEGVGGDDDAHFVAHPGVLHLGALFVTEAGVIRARGDASSRSEDATSAAFLRVPA